MFFKKDAKTFEAFETLQIGFEGMELSNLICDSLQQGGTTGEGGVTEGDSREISGQSQWNDDDWDDEF